MRQAIGAFLCAVLFSGAFLSGCGGRGPAGPTPPLLHTAVSPPSGGTAGGTLVTLTGSGFAVGATAVTVGGNTATDVTVVNSSRCTCRTPPAATAGAADVAVTTPG